MSKPYEVEGIVDKILGNGNYLVKITSEEGSSRIINCYMAGKMRQFKIKVIVGDKVRVVLPPPFDKGRITYRERG